MGDFVPDRRFQFVADLADAPCHGARADLLLTMPLDCFARYSAEIEQACRVAGLAAGERYAALTAAALWSRRGHDGGFRGDLADQIATDGAALLELADAWRPVDDTDGHCRAIEPCRCAPTRHARETCPAWRFHR